MKKYNKNKIKGDKLYKKKIDYLEKTVNNKGEITEIKEKSHNIEINSHFIKFFGINMNKILSLNKGELQVLFVILGTVAYGNDVFLTDILRNNIFKKQNSQRIRNALTQLFKYNILYKTELKGLYKFNHEIAFKGDARAYKKLLGIDKSVGRNIKVNLNTK